MALAWRVGSTVAHQTDSTRSPKVAAAAQERTLLSSVYEECLHWVVEVLKVSLPESLLDCRRGRNCGRNGTFIILIFVVF